MFVEDRSDTHRHEYFLTSNATLSPDQVVAAYCGRRAIETIFQECRSYLGVETIRGRCRPAVLRSAPCLFGLYAVVVLLHALPADKRGGGVQWASKATITFSDVLTAVHRWVWASGVFPHAGADTAIAKLRPKVQELLLDALAPAQ